MSDFQSELKKISDSNPGSLDIEEILSEYDLREQDYKTLSNLIGTSQTLRELKLHGISEDDLDHLVDGINRNRSITKLDMEGTDSWGFIPTLTRVLANNHSISELNLDHCDLRTGEMEKLAVFLRDNNTVTHLSVRRNSRGNEEEIVEALKGSPNILEFSVDEGDEDRELNKVCAANKKAAERLVVKALDHRDLSAGDLEDIKNRLSAFVHVAQNEATRDELEIARMFVDIQAVAERKGVEFPVPPRYENLAADLPRPFSPSGNAVNFAKISALNPRVAFQAARAGQVDGLLEHMQENGERISAELCLFKPKNEPENLIELVARQEKLAEVMAAHLWTGNPREFKAVAEAAPSREWRRQMKGQSLDGLVSQVNAASFKKAHQSQTKLC